MVANNLATQGARTSEANILTYATRDIPVSALESNFFKIFDVQSVQMIYAST